MHSVQVSAGNGLEMINSRIVQIDAFFIRFPLRELIWVFAETIALAAKPGDRYETLASSAHAIPQLPVQR